jgi:hypothetical protein
LLNYFIGVQTCGALKGVELLDVEDLMENGEGLVLENDLFTFADEGNCSKLIYPMMCTNNLGA